MMGNGFKSMTTLTGMLGLHVSTGNYKNWQWMRLHLGELQQTLAKSCKEDIDKEAAATISAGESNTHQGRVGIVVSSDTGWQGGGSHQTYNSPSGQTLLIGRYTKLILTFKLFSKLCYACNIFQIFYGTHHDNTPTHHCAKNWTESSKSMELFGIVNCVEQIWNSKKHGCKSFLAMTIPLAEQQQNTALRPRWNKVYSKIGCVTQQRFF